MTNLSTPQAKDFWIPALIFLPSVTTAYTSDQCALAQTCIIETFSESLYLYLKENLLCAPICKLHTFWTSRIRGQTFQVEMIFHSYCQIEDKELFSFAYFESLAIGGGGLVNFKFAWLKWKGVEIPDTYDGAWYVPFCTLSWGHHMEGSPPI